MSSNGVHHLESWSSAIGTPMWVHLIPTSVHGRTHLECHWDIKTNVAQWFWINITIMNPDQVPSGLQCEFTQSGRMFMVGITWNIIWTSKQMLHNDFGWSPTSWSWSIAIGTPMWVHKIPTSVSGGNHLEHHRDIKTNVAEWFWTYFSKWYRKQGIQDQKDVAFVRLTLSHRLFLLLLLLFLGHFLYRRTG
jgi:hypothetical protein